MKLIPNNRLAAAVTLGMLIWTAGPLLVGTPAAAASCNGVQIKSGASIGSAVKSHTGGTTFCLAPGTYNLTASVNPKNGDTFIGTGSTRGSTLVKTTSIQILFNNEFNKNVTFRHFAITGGVNKCPGSNCGATGRAISAGVNIHVDDMHLYGNGLNAIGGMGAGLVVNNSEIDHNGYKIGDFVSDGIKLTSPFTLTNSFIHDNKNSGVHCDLQCGAFKIAGNTIIHNTGTGILIELSAGPGDIHGNVVQNNNTSVREGKGGIGIIDSKNVNLFNNTLGGNNRFGIRAHMDLRVNCGPPSTTCGYVLSNVSIHDNDLNGDPIVGCRLDGVTCSNNAGKLPIR